MSTYQGKSGSMSVGGVTAAQLKSFTLNTTQDLSDTSAMGDNWKSSSPGLAEWKATAQLMLDKTAGTAQAALLDSLMVAAPTGAVLAMIFKIDQSANGRNWSGNAYVSDVQIQHGLGNVAMVSVSLQGSGALTPGAWS
jgi:hypothetical protein